MKRRMEHKKVVDAGMAAAKKVPHKKTERDVFPEKLAKSGAAKRLRGKKL